MDPDDDFLMHMISLTDVVKSDMKLSLDLDEDTINDRLHTLIATGLDDNSRYRVGGGETGINGGKHYSMRYVRAQCLLTEWLGLYRMIRVYLRMKRDRDAT